MVSAYIRVLLAGIISYIASGFIPIPSFGIPYGIDRAIVFGIVTLIIYIILEKLRI